MRHLFKQLQIRDFENAVQVFKSPIREDLGGMKFFSTLSILLLIISFTNLAFGGKIVYPWRSTTAIVKAGETFEVWFSADAGQIVNSVELQSQYVKVVPTMSNTVNQTWVYDKWSENTCNTKLTVTLPPNTPSDRYDLILKTSTGDEISLAAVNVIKDYKTSFYVFHISDAHRWQGAYDGIKILKMVATTIDIANIINPEIVLETGDNHYPNTNNAASTKQRAIDYYNGLMNGTELIKGLNNFSAPVFSVPGNHDTPQKNFQLEPGYPAAGYTKVPSQYYNEYYGLQAHNFSYGNARFIGLNNAWFPDDSNGVPNFSHQTDEAKTWLNEFGKGTFRIGYCHVMTPTPLKAFYDPLFKAGAPLNLILAGHCHWAGNTHSIKDYPNVKITHTGYPLRELHRKAAFNLYKVDLLTNKYTAIGDSIGAHEGLAIADDYTSAKLKLTFSKANNGSSPDNTATIVNKYNFPITDARVRFVVPKGSEYYVRNATIVQQFDGTDYHVIDAYYDLDANSTHVVTLHQGIQSDLCPDDPNKMDPGICGCGVPEGTCPIPATSISVNAENIRLGLKTERQLTATILPKNTTNKVVNWTSSNPLVSTVNSNGVVSAIGEGVASITASTYDNEKSTVCTVTVLPASNTYQAEDAEYVGPIEVTNQPGYNGRGFVDYSNPSNDYIKWSVYAPADGTYTLSFRYALTANRPLRLTLNDEVKIASVAFPITGSWSIHRASCGLRYEDPARKPRLN
ncbi:MAG: hypothetical protein GZ091_05580 [Paludibacter sp.]|nr:hypothetical protein [Paludibacter sp.]